MASELHGLADDTLPAGRPAGVAIALASILSVAFMAHHPTVHGRGTAAFVEEVTREAGVNGFVHGSLIVLVGVLVYGFSCLASRLGLNTVCGRAGLIAYVTGAAAGVAAALADGFVLPGFVARYQSRPTDELEIMWHVLALCAGAMHVCARLWMLGLSVAIVLWSMALAHRTGLVRAVGVLGCVAGALPVVGLLAGHLRINVHGALAFVLAQAVWGLAVAALLIRNRI
jgi:hypothetical protein